METIVLASIVLVSLLLLLLASGIWVALSLLIVAMAMMVVSVLWCVRAHRPAAVAGAEAEH